MNPKRELPDSEPPAVQERERSITPYAPFDARPKAAAQNPTRAPVDPFEGLPRLHDQIPRAPRLPGDTARLLRREQDEIATDPAPPLQAESGEYPLSESEKTPLESPYSLKNVSKKLDDILEVVTLNANETVSLRGEVRSFRTELQQLTKRVISLEVTQRWAPLLLGAVALVVSLWAVNELRGVQDQLRRLEEGSHVSTKAPVP